MTTDAIPCRTCNARGYIPDPCECAGYCDHREPCPAGCDGGWVCGPGCEECDREAMRATVETPAFTMRDLIEGRVR